MCMVAGFALIISSCKKKDDVTEMSISVPAFEEEVDGRAYIDINDNKFKWNANDEVVIYNLDNKDGGNQSERAIYRTTANAEGQTLATFSYNRGDVLSAKKYGYFVFYPATKINEQNALDGDNYETFTVDNLQNYTVVNGAPTTDPAGMAMACDLANLNGTFTLKHIFGNLRLKLKGTGKVTSIVVEDSRFNLSGSASMKLHNVKMEKFSSLQNVFINTDDPYGDYAFKTAWAEYMGPGQSGEGLNYSTQGGGKTMTLDCGEGVQLNNSSETHFFIGLRPGALKYGFKVYVYVDGNDTPYLFDYTEETNNNLHYGIKAGVNKGLSLAGIN